MAQVAYGARVIVLRKTKLGESDLILTLLAKDGSQIRAVAKGARKPTSPFASRLELFSVAEVMLHPGRNLDIVTEARLLRDPGKLRFDIERATGAAPVAELLENVTQRDLENPRLFDLTDATLSRLATVDISLIPAITVAHILKTLSLSGFRPSFLECAVCGDRISWENAPSHVPISFEEGGVVCGRCRQETETVAVTSETCAWAHMLITSSFDEIVASGIGPTQAFPILQFAQSWTRQHIGKSMKSLDFMLTCNLYEET